MLEETTWKAAESNVPRIDKKIDKMQQDLGDFIDELEVEIYILVMRMNLQRMKRLEVNSIGILKKRGQNTDKTTRHGLKNKVEDPDAVIDDI